MWRLVGRQELHSHITISQVYLACSRSMSAFSGQQFLEVYSPLQNGGQIAAIHEQQYFLATGMSSNTF